MMATFRKIGNTKASKAFMTVLALSFVAWGVGGYLMHTTGAAALTVNGEDIPVTALNQAYKGRIQQIQQLLGGKIPAAQLAQMNIIDLVINELKARVVMRTTAESLGLVASTRNLQDEIMAMRAFTNAEGAFDAAKYRAILAQNNRTPEQFERDLGRDLAVRNLAALVGLPTPAAAIVAPQAALDDATLKLEVATLTPAVVGALPTPSQAQLETFYKENESAYTTQEARDVQVLAIAKADVAKTITIPESRIEEEYKANQAAYNQPETRTVRHILLESKDAADKLAPQIKTVTDIERLAKTESKDPGSAAKGGLLGTIAQKDVVDSFGKVAFSLPVNKLSAPVQSPFGWHLIWVEGITPGHTQTLADVKDKILSQLKDAEADNAMADLTKKVDEKIAGGSTLDEVAQAFGLKVQNHPMLKATEDILTAPEMEAAFATPAGRVASPISTEDGGITYIGVTKIMVSKLPELATVKARVQADWQSAQLQSALQQRGTQLLNALRAPGVNSMVGAIASLKVSGITTATLELKHMDSVPEWLQPQLLNLYPMPVGGTLPAVLREKTATDTLWHVVRLVGRTPATVGADALATATKLYHQRLQSDVEGLVMGALVQQAKVRLNQPRIQQVVGTPATTE